MKNNPYILIYDDKCPLCAAYTNAFVKCGILNNDGRKSFTTVDVDLLQKTDTERSKNEIPLIDTATGNVYYGIDALLELLNTKLTGIKKLGTVQPLYWFLKKLYNFISYNRKVIVATKCSKGQYDCSPAFSYKWRTVFLIFFLCINTLALFPVHKYVFANSLFNGSSVYYLQLLHTVLIGSNIMLAATLPKQKAFEYIGQVNMLATIVVLSLLLLSGVNRYLFISAAFNNVYLLGLTLFIFKDYIRRMKYAGTLQTSYITAINFVCISGFLALLLFA
jgi:predicted DCC family thiol-disulfide oxidoreductase YuxK